MAKSKNDEKLLELTIFKVGEIICALDILQIKEIIKHLEISSVKNAPDYVRGVASLRGEIISVIDVGIKFGFEKKVLNEDMRIIVINYKGENTGLLVDKILDVHMVDAGLMEPLTSNISGVKRDYFTGIYKMDSQLATVLNTEELLKFNHSKADSVR